MLMLLPTAHYKIGKELRALREQGVLLFGTGNIVHNLRLVDWNKENEGFDWAYEFDEYIYENILNKNNDNILKFNEIGNSAKLAVPTPDHFYPLLYVLERRMKMIRSVFIINPVNWGH